MSKKINSPPDRLYQNKYFSYSSPSANDFFYSRHFKLGIQLIKLLRINIFNAFSFLTDGNESL